MYVLKDDLIEAPNIYFERANEQITFLYLGPDLILMDMFKVVSGGQLVEDTCDRHPTDLVSSPSKDIQVKYEDNKETEDANLEVIYPRGTLE